MTETSAESEQTPQTQDAESNEELTEQSPEQSNKPPAKEQAYAEVPGDLACRIEAALLLSDRAMRSNRLAEVLVEGELSLPEQAIAEAVESLNEEYGKTGRSFRIEQVAGGYRMMTLPEYADVLSSMDKTQTNSKLSATAIETLAIVAYKQPIMRSEVEAIRGVACGEVLRALLDRRLIKIVGRAEELGRPMLYGTTTRFLELFGLASLKDLPSVEELRR